MNLIGACERLLHSSPTPVASDEGVTRRRVLTGGALLGYLTARAGAQVKRGDAGGQAEAAGVEGRPRDSAALRLLKRCTYGVDAEQLQLIGSMTPEQYIEYHLAYESIDDSVLNGRLVNEFPTLFMTPSELFQQDPARVVGELVFATILRSATSKRQLFERMVEFWTDHFNIDITNGADQFLKTVDDREVIRSHALGRFPELLTASAMSPAMLFYLDNYSSRAGNPNENYARELLELHTMGAGNGYTEQDVREVARCFTGWTITPPRDDGGGTFRFERSFHDFGQKRVLGVTIPAGRGIEDGLMVIDILTRSAAVAPITARFVARKLARWLWGYNPSEALVGAMVSDYLATDGDIRAMVRTALRHALDWNTDNKFKRPYHYVASVLRGLGAGIVTPRALVPSLQALGQVPFYWSPPDGYPDSLEFWSGLLLPRWNFCFSLLNRELPGITFDLTAFLGDARTAQQVADVINAKLFASHMPQAEYDRIVAFLLPNNPPFARIRDAISLALAMPTFQWY